MGNWEKIKIRAIFDTIKANKDNLNGCFIAFDIKPVCKFIREHFTFYRQIDLYRKTLLKGPLERSKDDILLGYVYHLLL